MTLTLGHSWASARRVLVPGGLAVALVASVGFAANLALQACALRLPWMLSGLVPVACPVVVPMRHSDLSDARRLLEQRIQAAELRLASVRCPAPVARGFVPADPAPLPPLPVQDRQVVPDDLTSLEGCWALDSVYRTKTENEPIYTHYSEWQMCFDAEGSGRAKMKGRKGDQFGPYPSSAVLNCSGMSTASFDDAGNLVIIEEAAINCEGGSAPYRREMLCRLMETGGAECESIQPESPSYYPGRPPHRGVRFRALGQGE